MARPFYKPSPKNEPPQDTPDDNGKLRPGRGKESYKLACFWKDQVEGYEQFNQRWFARGNTVLKRYRDERSKMENEGLRRFNILWANVQIMKPAIYSRQPDPIVDRRFLDKDPIGRLSSVILERTIISQMDHGFHSAMNRAVYDRLLPGRGQVWLRYENELEEDEESVSVPTQNSNSLEDSIAKIAKDVGDKELIEETKEDEALEETGDITLVEKIITDYIDWRDFYTFPARARTWEEVQAVGKRVYMSKQECMERFGEDIAKEMQPDTTPESSANNRTSITDTQIFKDVNDRSIVVYEIWNKSDRRVYWVSNGYEFLCDVRKDPYKLKKFFPCPKPLSATVTNDSLTPVPDYFEYQDQAIQIDELTQRIAMLTKACKVAGVYNSAQKSLARIFEEVSENQLIGVDQWAMFAEAGGIKGAIDFVPLDQIQACIKTLQEVRQSAQQDLDQITGLSDVVRGTTDSRETLGGIRLKNNNAGTRLSENQEEVQRFARDAIAIIGELAAKHFEDDTLVAASGIMYDEEMQPDAVLREFEPVMPGFMATNKSQSVPGANNPAAPGAGNGPSPNSIPPINTPQQTGQPQNNNVLAFPGGQPVQSEQQMPDPQVIIGLKLDAAIKLLRKDVPRGYRISIETDSTIFGDKMQERQDASDFIEALGGYMANFERLGQEVPEAMPLLGRGLEWAVRKFRIGRDLEAEINSFVSRMEKKAKKLIENPQPSIEQQKLNADKEKNERDSQLKIQLAQMEAQRQEQDDMRQAAIQERNDQRDFQKQQAEDMRQAALDQQKAELEKQKMAMEMEKAKMDMQIAVMEHQLKMAELKAKMHMETTKSNMEMQHSAQEHQMNMQSQAHQQAMAVDEHNMQREQHNMQREQAKDDHKMAKESHKMNMEGTKQKADLQKQQHQQKQQALKQNKGKK